MIKIHQALTEIIESNPLYTEAFSEGILNLSEFARKIHPLVEARTQKDVQLSALIMNLSRLSRTKQKAQKTEPIKLKNIYMNSGLVLLTAHHRAEVEEKIHEIYKMVKQNNGYITISHGVHEITLIFDSQYSDAIQEKLKDQVKSLIADVSSIGVSFDEKTYRIPGLLSRIIQSIAQQGISTLELASTYTELIIYIASKDRTLCFDTLQRKFF